jgi:hypothetical protein
MHSFILTDALDTHFANLHTNNSLGIDSESSLNFSSCAHLHLVLNLAQLPSSRYPSRYLSIAFIW